MIQVLVRLIIPIGTVAALLGLILIAVSLRRVMDAGPRPDSSTLEKVAVVLCGIVATLGLIAISMNAIRGSSGSNPFFYWVLALMILMGSPALVWRSRWRVPAEGVATIAVAGFAVLAGFSIGFGFVPLVAAMILVCVRHLRMMIAAQKLARSQVDSPP